MCRILSQTCRMKNVVRPPTRPDAGRRRFPSGPPLRRAIATGAVVLGASSVGLVEVHASRASAAPTARVAIDGGRAVLAPGVPVPFSVAACSGVAVRWTVTDADGARVATGTAPGPDHVVAADLVPVAGVYRLTVDCGEASGSTRFVRSPGPSTSADTFFSLNVAGSPGPTPGALPTFEAIGAAGYRQDVQWQAVEKTDGRFDFSPVDARVDPWVRGAGVAPLFVLDYGNTVHTGGPMTPPDLDDPAQRAAWERFVTETVVHMRDRHPDADRSYEVWNEWNNFHGDQPATPEAYLPLAEVTFHAVRAADPDARVVGPGVNAVSASELDWMQRWFAGGGAEWVDAISVHPYAQPWAPELCSPTLPCFESALRALRTMASEHPGAAGTPLPLWITEFGWPSEGVSGVPEGDVAAFLVRAHAIAALTGVERVHTFELFRPDGALDRSFGLVNGPASGWEPRPVTAAYLTMQRALGGLRPVRSQVHGTVRQVEFRAADTGRTVHVVWSTAGRFSTEQTTVPVTTDVDIVEPYGARKTVRGQDGGLRMTATWQPRFVEVRG